MSAPVLPGRDPAGRSSTSVHGNRHPASGTARGLTNLPVGGVEFNDAGSAWDAASVRHSELGTAEALRSSWQSSVTDRSGVRSEDGDPLGPERHAPTSSSSRRAVGDAVGAPTSQLVASLFQGVQGRGSRGGGSSRRHDRSSGDEASVDTESYHRRSEHRSDRSRKSSSKSRSHRHGHKPPRHHSESDQYSDDDVRDVEHGEPPADAEAVKELEEHTAALKLEIAKQEAETRRLAQQRAECEETAKQLVKEVRVVLAAPKLFLNSALFRQFRGSSLKNGNARRKKRSVGCLSPFC
jgi:uncharacterized small protein (DUF1192 family)